MVFIISGSLVLIPGSTKASVGSYQTFESNGFESYDLGTSGAVNWLGSNWTSMNFIQDIQTYNVKVGSKAYNLTGNSASTYACWITHELSVDQVYNSLTTGRAVYRFWLDLPTLETDIRIYLYHGGVGPVCWVGIESSNGSVSQRYANGFDHWLTGTVSPDTWYGFYIGVNFFTQQWTVDFNTTMPTSGQYWTTLVPGSVEYSIDEFWITGNNLSTRQIVLDAFSVQFLDPGTLVDASPLVLTDEPTNPVTSGSGVEVSDFRMGHNNYCRWFGASGVSYATSTNGVTWTNYTWNPILSGYIYPDVIRNGAYFYLFAKNISSGNLFMFNVTTHTSPTIMNGGAAIFYRSPVTTDWNYLLLNIAVAIGPNGYWYMLLESKYGTGDTNYNIGFAHSTYAELNWTAHKSAKPVMYCAGNPWLTYVPNHNTLLAIYGDVTSGYWEVRAAFATIGASLTLTESWNTVPDWIFEINVPLTHVCDPSLATPWNGHYPIMIAYSYDQGHIFQTYYDDSMERFFSQLTGEAQIHFSAQLSPLVTLIYQMLAIGIVLGVIAEGTNSIRKQKMHTTEQMMKSLFNMVIYIVVGLALLGAAYSMAA